MIEFKTWFSSKEVHIVLGDSEFGSLIQGREVRQGQVRIILSDIGWKRMLELIGDAMRGTKQ